MTGSGIFLLGANEELVPLNPRPYDSEDLLQELLAKYPALIAGDQVDPAAPRRWLLISREIGVPAEEHGAGRWSLDHLFLDQDAIPTLIEVKRSSDTRIRREVVGQLLDYAANAIAYWPIELIQSAYSRRCEMGMIDAEKELRNFLGPERDSAAFWLAVKTNLQAGRVRLVFVADEIPVELRRIVEFLNLQMDPAEVIALEIKQYVGGGHLSWVPRVVGQTEQANRKRQAGGVSGGRQWTVEEFFADIEDRFGPAVRDAARRVVDWASGRGATITLGKGRKDGSLYPMFKVGDRSAWPIGLLTYGKVEFQFQWLRNVPPFGSLEARQELQRLLNKIPGVAIPADALDRRPSMPLAALVDPATEQALLVALDWCVTQLKKATNEDGTGRAD